MEYLPPEILHHIFRNFPLEYQVSNFRPVCSNWAVAVDTSPEWRNYCFTIDTRDNDYLLILEKNPSLQVLKIHFLNDALSKAINSLQFKLRDLKIVSFNLDFDISRIAEIISSCFSSLKKLSISGDVFINDKCAKVISQCDRLEELDIFCPGGQRWSNHDQSLMILADSGCPIKKFTFCRSIFSNHTLNKFFLMKGKEITSLGFHNDCFTCRAIDGEYKDWNWFEKSLSSKIFSNLTEFSCIWEHYRHYLQLIFDYCPRLLKVELNTSIVFNHDLENIYKCTNLDTLRIESCYEIDDLGISHIAKCNNLTVLYLNTVFPVFDLGMNSLLKMKNLRTLEMPLSTFPLEFYLQIAHRMIHLRKLKVRKIEKSVLLQIQKSLPHLEITEYEPEYDSSPSD